MSDQPITAMDADKAMAIVDAVRSGWSLVGGPRATHLLMSRKTVIAFARACAVDISDDWRPTGSAEQIWGTPVLVVDSMAFGDWQLVQITTLARGRGIV